MIFERGHRITFTGSRREAHTAALLRTLRGTVERVSEGRILADGQPARIGVVLLRPARVTIAPLSDTPTGQTLHPE